MALSWEKENSAGATNLSGSLSLTFFENQG